jgi:hypothetical protein
MRDSEGCGTFATEIRAPDSIPWSRSHFFTTFFFAKTLQPMT